MLSPFPIWCCYPLLDWICILFLSPVAATVFSTDEEPLFLVLPYFLIKFLFHRWVWLERRLYTTVGSSKCVCQWCPAGGIHPPHLSFPSFIVYSVLIYEKWYFSQINMSCHQAVVVPATSEEVERISWYLHRVGSDDFGQIKVWVSAS